MGAAAEIKRSRAISARLCKDAGLPAAKGEDAFHVQNWGGAGWLSQKGDNERQVQFVEAFGIYPCLPGGRKADPELVRLHKDDDRDGFRSRFRELLKDGCHRDAPGAWGREDLKPGDINTRASQMSLLFFAKRGDVVIMTSSGRYATDELTGSNARFAIGVFSDEPRFEWMAPEDIGAVRGADAGYKQKRGGGWTRKLAGPLAVRRVTWVREGRYWDVDDVVRKYFNQIVQPTVAQIRAKGPTSPKGGLPRVLDAFLKAAQPIQIVRPPEAPVALLPPLPEAPVAPVPPPPVAAAADADAMVVGSRVAARGRSSTVTRIAHGWYSVAFDGTEETQSFRRGKISLSAVEEAAEEDGPAAKVARIEPPAAAEEEVNHADEPDEFVCSITHDLMTDPVAATDGHSYERAALEKWLRRSETSPKTGAEMDPRIVPNHALRRAIERWRSTRGSEAN